MSACYSVYNPIKLSLENRFVLLAASDCTGFVQKVSQKLIVGVKHFSDTSDIFFGEKTSSGWSAKQFWPTSLTGNVIGLEEWWFSPVSPLQLSRARPRRALCMICLEDIAGQYILFTWLACKRFDLGERERCRLGRLVCANGFHNLETLPLGSLWLQHAALLVVVRHFTTEIIGKHDPLPLWTSYYIDTAESQTNIAVSLTQFWPFAETLDLNSQARIRLQTVSADTGHAPWPLAT